MPLPASDIAALRADVMARLDRLVRVAHSEGRAQALREIRDLVGGGAPVKRGPGSLPKDAEAAPAKAGRKRRKSSWAGLTPAEHLARVNAIRKGRGLPPRGA